jgi:hypothetical protein
MIYFIQAGETGPIKIGYTEGAGTLETRFAALQGANAAELRLLATRFGSIEDERQFHRRFAAGRLRGEWFRPDAEGLAELVEESKRLAGIVPWQLRDDGVQLCEWCEVREVVPPRRLLCSDRCSQERREFRADRQRLGI